MPVTVLLCRWNGGWREVRNDAAITTYGRREALMGLGALQSPQEVDRVAAQQLAIFADQRMAIAADLEPMGVADRPYRAWNVGDTITVPAYGGGTISQRVRALTGAEDANGEVTYSPELGDLILETQERTEQALKKMADGTLEGESPVATPVAQVQQAQRTYGGAPMPPGGLRISTAADDVGGAAYTGVSDILDGGGGGTTYTLVSFTAQVPESHQVDGTNTHFVLRNFLGDIAYDVAEINLGVDHGAGTFTGTINQTTMTTTGGWQIQIVGGGQFVGPFKATATVTTQGADIELAWYPLT